MPWHRPFSLRAWAAGRAQSGAAQEAMVRDRKTSINPSVFDAAMIVIITSRAESTFPGIAGHEPDLKAGRETAERVTRAMNVIRAAIPDAGTYGNEGNYFETDWKRSFYGAHYDRLLEIKPKYDPMNLFKLHQGVGRDL